MQLLFSSKTVQLQTVQLLFIFTETYRSAIGIKSDSCHLITCAVVILIEDFIQQQVVDVSEWYLGTNKGACYQRTTSHIGEISVFADRSYVIINILVIWAAFRIH